MGGICGIWDTEENIEEDLINSMSSVLSHRGPDSSGVFVDKHIGLGSKRLSIIDSSANQPIHNEDKTTWIVYNGEFYNFIVGNCEGVIAERDISAEIMENNKNGYHVLRIIENIREGV